MATIGYATLQVIPSMQGVEGALTGLVGGPAQTAGKQAGGVFTGAFSSALKVGAVVAGAVVATGAALYKVGGVFDDVTDTIRTGTGATGDALDGLVTVAKNVGTSVPAEFSKIGPTVADLNTRLGLTGPVLERVASQYLEAGRILGSDVDIGATTAAFSAFRIEGDAVEGAMDSLFQVSQATGVGMNELAGIVQSAGPTMQNLGFGFEETAALAGTLDKAGLDANKTMSSLSKGLVTLAKDGEEPQDAFRRVTGELTGLVEQGKTAEALDLASTIFGTRGAAQFVGAVQSGALNLDNLVASAGMSSDTILGVGRDTADLAEQWQLFKNQALVTIEPVATRVFTALGDGMAFINTTGVPAITAFASVAADRLVPAITSAGEFLTGTLVPGLRDASTWLQTNSTTVAAVAAVIGVVLLPMFASMAVAAVSSGASTVGAWAAQRTAAVTSAAAQVAAHYRTAAGWVVSGAAAVASGAQTVAIWTLYKVQAAQGAAATVAAHARMAGAWVVSAATSVGSAVAAGAAWVASSARTVGALTVQGAAFVAQRAVMVAGAAATGLVTAAQWAYNAALNANPIGLVVLALAALVGALVFAWNNSETFRAVVTGAWEGVKSAASAVGQWFTVTVPRWWSDVLASTRSTWDSVVGKFTEVRGKVSDAVNTVLGVVKTVFSYTPIGLITNNFGAIVSFFAGIPGRIMDALGDVGGMLKTAGSKIIEGFASGITGAVGKVTSAVSGVVSKVRDYLPFSPAKVGPMSGRGWSGYSGRAVTSDFASGMLANRDKLTNASAQLVKAATIKVPEPDVGRVFAYRAQAVPEPAAETFSARGGAGARDGERDGITIYGNVGWSLDEVESQRRTRSRRRRAVRGV